MISFRHCLFLTLFFIGMPLSNADGLTIDDLRAKAFKFVPRSNQELYVRFRAGLDVIDETILSAEWRLIVSLQDGKEWKPRTKQAMRFLHPVFWDKKTLKSRITRLSVVVIQNDLAALIENLVHIYHRDIAVKNFLEVWGHSDHVASLLDITSKRIQADEAALEAATGLQDREIFRSIRREEGLEDAVLYEVPDNYIDMALARSPEVGQARLAKPMSEMSRQRWREFSLTRFYISELNQIQKPKMQKKLKAMFDDIFDFEGPLIDLEMWYKSHLQETVSFTHQLLIDRQANYTHLLKTYLYENAHYEYSKIADPKEFRFDWIKYIHTVMSTYDALAMYQITRTDFNRFLNPYF